MENVRIVADKIIDGKYEKRNLNLSGVNGRKYDKVDAYFKKDDNCVALAYNNAVYGIVVKDATNYNPSIDSTTLFVEIDNTKSKNEIKNGLYAISHLSMAVGDVTLISVVNGDYISTHYNFDKKKKLEHTPFYDRSMKYFNCEQIAYLSNNHGKLIVEAYDSDKKSELIIEPFESIMAVNNKDYVKEVCNSLYPEIEKGKTLVKR